MSRLPLTIWAFFVTTIIGVVSFPVTICCALLIMDSLEPLFFTVRYIYSRRGVALSRRITSMYEHLFWFLGHPEVYIVLLPALGMTSEIIAAHARKPIGYRAMASNMSAFYQPSFGAPHVYFGMNPF